MVPLRTYVRAAHPCTATPVLPSEYHCSTGETGRFTGYSGQRRWCIGQTATPYIGGELFATDRYIQFGSFLTTKKSFP